MNEEEVKAFGKDLIKAGCAIALVAAVLFLFVLLGGCQSRIDNLLMPGAPRSAVIAVYGLPHAEIGERLYWCRYPSHVTTKEQARNTPRMLTTAHFIDGKLVAYPAHLYEYNGECDDLIEWWADRLEYAESLGMEERWK